jgi:hypothetical protein
VSIGYHDGLRGAFKIMTVNQEEIAYFEAQCGGRLSFSDTEVTEFGVTFTRIGDEALNISATRDLIRSVLEAL